MRNLPAIFLLLAILPAGAQLSQPVPELIRVNPHVYCAAGYALGNVIFILTERSVVVVDTTEGQAPAQAALDAFRKVSALPVSYIIYTHHHGDHIHGAKVFATPETKVIAQKNHIEEMRKYRLMFDYNRRLNQVQWAASVPREQRGATLGVDLLHPAQSGYIPPQITFDEEYRFTEGGVRFELYHTLGETVDHLMVWLPDFETLLPGDLFYWSFPMLASPGKPDRPVLEWAASLDRMRQLHPAYLAGSHSRPLEGRDTIDQALANYARAIRFVHEQTVKRINDGEPLYKIRDGVRLPPDLAALPYLQPVYGTVAWAVNGVFRQYTGWYDFDPAHLNGGDPEVLDGALAEAAGGSAAIVERARKAQADGQLLLALELAEVAIAADNNAAAHHLRKDLLERLAAQAANGVARNVYLEAAAGERP
ncbi:MAG TPA: alkyl sulfatase dimerization domain-containing protein [Bryobacteraceae bacterium]|nr:alkyl sulfatase dimerization domain-containing protein [Bryobacteraceae bacterium]